MVVSCYLECLSSFKSCAPPVSQCRSFVCPRLWAEVQGPKGGRVRAQHSRACSSLMPPPPFPLTASLGGGASLSGGGVCAWTSPRMLVPPDPAPVSRARQYGGWGIDFWGGVRAYTSQRMLVSLAPLPPSSCSKWSLFVPASLRGRGCALRGRCRSTAEPRMPFSPATSRVSTACLFGGKGTAYCACSSNG